MSDHSQSTDPSVTANGFQLSEEPLVNLGPRAEAEEELPATSGSDLLYSLPRDPTSLFVYWDVNWARVFDRAGLSRRPVHLRVYRNDGEIDSSREINPFRGHCYVEVSAPGADYSCALGCFEGEQWKELARAGTTATPRAALSEDLSATFATLPLHLSFQRLLEIFEERRSDADLAYSVAELQGDPAASGKEPESTTPASDLAEELRSCAQPVLQAIETEEQRARWEEVLRRIAAESQFGGSSPF